jgi:hypothetical protein
MTKPTMPATAAEPMLVSIDLRSMEVWTDDGRDAYLRALDVCKVDSANAVYVNGKLCSIGNFELYGELLSFDATPIDGGSQHG